MQMSDVFADGVISAGVATRVGVAFATSSVIRLWTGSPPSNCEAADSGTMVAEVAIGAGEWTMVTGSNSEAELASGNFDPTAVGGTPGYFRIYDTSNVCVMQGTCGTSGTDMVIDTSPVPASATVTITSFSFEVTYTQ